MEGVNVKKIKKVKRLRMCFSLFLGFIIQLIFSLHGPLADAPRAFAKGQILIHVKDLLEIQ